MKWIATGTMAVALLAATGVSAQDEPPVVFAQYLRCAPAQQDRANEIVRTVIGPIMQKHVDAGHLSGWGWRTHVRGGSWRALSTLVGTDIPTMMDVSSQIVAEVQEQHPDAGAEFSTICSSHDDYIWVGVSNSPPNPDAVAGPASISTYYVCQGDREGRADEIFQELLAPLYQKHTDMGHLSNWGFFSHRSGGQFRRLETFSGADHKTLMDMLSAIYNEAIETDPLAFNEFRQICGTHTDYMWINPFQQ